MQGGRHPPSHPHHLHQQLAALVSAALPSQKPNTTATTTTATAANPSSSSASSAEASPAERKNKFGGGGRDDDAERAAALDSLHRAIIYPPNSFLLPHSAPFLSQALSQLLSDKSYAVRRAAAIAYGSLCAVLLNSAPHSPPGGLPDRFLSWALPLLRDANADASSVESALEGLTVLLDVADAGPAERLVPPALKACQELLEDDRTSLSLLRRLLGLLTLMAVKFGSCFQPHFVDTVDLLLGWAFVPNLSESDRRVIMDSFTQFRQHWFGNLQFSVGLLAKFLGDMDVLIHDAGLEAGRSLDRSLALFSCFFTVLQVTASAALEMNTIERMAAPLLDMAPRLLRCISMFGAKFGWLKWAADLQRCLLLLAEILGEKFAEFYELASDTLFQSLRGSTSSIQVQAALKTNLQLLSLQNMGLLPSSVRTLLQFHSPLSQLRLHPNHLVVANSAATYLFFLKHGSEDVVAQAIVSLLKELESLKAMLGKLHLFCSGLGALSLDVTRDDDQLKSDVGPGTVYSESELLSLTRFDLQVLLAPVSFDAAKNLLEKNVLDTLRYERTTRVASAILEKLNPFEVPFHDFPELQFHIFRTLHKLSEVELLSQCALSKTSSERVRTAVDGQSRDSHESKNLMYNIIVKYTTKYGVFIVRALKVSSPLTVKLEALDWIRTFSSVVLRMEKSPDVSTNFRDTHGDCIVDSDILNSVLDSAYDRESKVRSHVASSLEVLFQAKLINPGSYSSISQVALDKIGDPDKSVRDAFVRVMSVILPVTVYSCGLLEDGVNISKLVTSKTANKCYMDWRHVLAVEKLQRELHSHQLVSILSYISQRWKVPLSSWVQRLVFSSHSKREPFSSQHELVGDVGTNNLPRDVKLEEEVLDKICPVNNLAAVWWCIHEAARYCINLRLRTNLGGPTQTFAALERMLIDIPNVLTLDVKQGDSMYMWSSDMHLLPMRLLLEFVEALKKNVYTAYEGSFVLPSLAKQSSLFFRANKKVCEEWFSRMSEPMLNAGLALQCDDAILHYCVLRLLDLKNLLGSSSKDKRVTLEDVLKVLRHASLALCRCHESDALVGLQKWATITFSSIIEEDGLFSPVVAGSLANFSWITGLVYQARGQYEKAAAHYSHLLQSEEALVSMGSDGIQFIIARVIECYTSLSDWNCLESWLAELQKLRATHAGKAYSGALTAAGTELNAIHALARFDYGDFHAAWGYLDLTPKSSSELTLDPKVALERSEQMLLRSMLQGEGSIEELDKAKLILDEALSVAPLDGLIDAAAYAVQLHCIFAFEEGATSFESNISPEREILVNSLVEQAAHLIEAAAGAPGFESYEVGGPSAALSSQLLVLLCTNGALEKDIVLPLVDELIGIWWSLRRRRVLLFGNAAHGYFQYLSHSSSKLQASPSCDSMEGKTRSCTLRAVLHVLHIILNYGVELKETLEFGLSTVPLLPWQEIIPQLFARLGSHPEKEVRKLLEGILMMLGKLSPCSIVYPTLVDLNAYEGKPSEELQHILDHLVKLYPKLIQDVKLVIEELGMITVLWEEQWLSTLQDLHSDVIRRLNVLKEETARVAANPTLTLAEKNKINAAKYSAMMAPIIVALERRMASTSREPRTSHETWFHKEYTEQLKSAILGLKTPPASATTLADVWRPFEAIAASLYTHQRKSFISLSEVAPQLATLATSDIPMPGLEKQVSKIVTISSFCDQMTILSTKTKPKKLVLMGSDGQKYTYLLKGREDLRLDARIMQLLEAVNSFLYSSGDAYSRSLSIRYYSVTPISGRAGLIQWVNNATSIYSVYKSWQKRMQLAQLSAVGAINLNNPLPPVPRPSDMFYGKIIPALKEKGIKRVISRRDWPLEVKRKVLLELMKETPKQLLWQEMWCASEGFKSFNLKTKRFSGSVAAMSMMGHILGLGDRHLDNILMDFFSGEVVHIDYNICFDKGKKLKIPEIVPFRLTQTIEAALGLTGIEGTFRANCETVMTVLKKNKDIILMLLEVFVWDPLIEWTRGNNQDEAAIAGEEKKGMELAVSLSLFSSRVQEIRVPLQEHHDLLLSTLPAAESALKGFLDVLNQYEIISAIFYHADKERSSLMQLETSAKSIVAEATSLAEKCRASCELHTNGLAQAKAVTAEEVQELALWVDQHARVLDALRDGALPGAQKQLSSSEEVLSLTSAVLVSGVPLTIVPEPTQVQCYDMDKEIFHLMTELENGLCSGIEALHEYALTLQRVLPINYMATTPVSGWAQVLQLSVNNLSADVLSIAKRRAVDLVAKAQGEGLDLVQQRHQDLLYKMESYIEEIKKLDGNCSQLVNSIGSDNEAQSKELLLSSFMKYMQPSGHSKNGDDTEEKRENILFILGMAMSELYRHVVAKVIAISNKSVGSGIGGHQPDLATSIHEFDEQIERCVLIMRFAREVEEATGKCLPSTIADNKFVSGNWITTFQALLQSGTHLIEQMTEVVLPEIIRSVISHNSEVMEAFGSLSQIRGSIDTALEKIVQVELERASLVELEKSYFVKVGAITEQQIALEEAAVQGRDHLSWEEAEELASQEEACRAQLDQLHQSWSKRDVRASSLSKIETSVMNSLASSEQYFASLISIKQEGDSYMTRSKALLATLTKPFMDMEPIDLLLSSYSSLRQSLNEASFNLSDLVSSGYSPSELLWALASLLKHRSFFIWKVIVVDSVLDLCMHEISSSVDHNFSFDQLYNSLRKKLVRHLREQIRCYFKERVAPALISQLDKENDYLQRVVEKRRELASDQLERDVAAARKVRLMLEEYCNAHETVRAARAAVSLMKKQRNELIEALGKTILEIVQLEWLNDLPLPYSLTNKVLSQNMFGENKFFTFLLNLSRTKLLEKIQTSMSSVSKSVERLQAFERVSVSAEEQLERAMGWATGSSGIPPEFHDHLLRRRQLLWAAQEQASDIVKICSAVMEFEASRDGLFWMPGEKSSGRTARKGRAWQQAYLNSLTQLDAAYHSFTRAEKEWNLAQHNMETAANGLFSATNQLHIASVKANSASVDLHDTLATMHECACQASAALSAYSRVSKGHTALTSECGTMLDEVLAITEGLHDVYNLGKEAAAAHSALMTDLSKANMMLLPLETSLSTDLAAIANGKLDERDSNGEISLHHAKTLYESYIYRLRETCQSLAPLVPSITHNTKELHFMLNKLAQISSLHARNLHKALEDLGGSQMVRSQEDLSLSRSELLQGATLFNNEDKEPAERNESGTQESITAGAEFSVQDDEWISPPEHTYTSSSGSITTLTESSFSENSETVEQLLHDKSAGLSSGNPDGEESTYAGNSQMTGDHSGNSTSAEPADEQILSFLNEAIVKDTEEDTKLLSRENAEFVKQVKGHASSTENLNRPSDSANRAMRGKNTFALSVLKQVEQKLHGRDIEGTRSLEISEQVDHLLKQAASIDNLCHMYEGWTPWI
ncbi:Serine/threonine-protein kinase SMG1 [Ananas comosus]|uniref:non-specific serine/threonine protein kinase n=1 Tax=Ananas comosus TaxID=4615 RepID=A0A199VUS1_ANACO|nr:Serine/threonine-protein kinase SMG1 [Ananas comosus]